MGPRCIPVAKPILPHMGYPYRIQIKSHMGGAIYGSYKYCLLGQMMTFTLIFYSFPSKTATGFL